MEDKCLLGIKGEGYGRQTLNIENKKEVYSSDSENSLSSSVSSSDNLQEILSHVDFDIHHNRKRKRYNEDQNQEVVWPKMTGMEVIEGSASKTNSYISTGMPEANIDMVGMKSYGRMPYEQGTLMVTPVKEVISFTKSVLYPPNSTALPHSTRSKPLNRKTIYVGGLPQMTNEDILIEMFESCGEITDIQMNRKHFCHITFADESSAEKAVIFSGCIMKIDNRDEACYTGKLHVDYSRRKNQYGYEKSIRKNSALSPPLYTYFSSDEALVLAKELKGEDTFSEALFTLTTWLKQGKCTKENASTFYCLLQSVHSRLNYLEPKKYSEEEIMKRKFNLKEFLHSTYIKFKYIKRIFDLSQVQKVWDQFSKAQRRGIEMMRKSSDEYQIMLLTEERKQQLEEEKQKLKEEKKDLTERVRNTKETARNLKVKYQLDLKLKEFELQTCHMRLKNIKEEFSDKEDDQNISTVETSASCSSYASTSDNLSGDKARLIGIISVFLNIHHLGATAETIIAYLENLGYSIQKEEVETLLKDFPSVFKEDMTGDGPQRAKRWKFCGF